jgi:hypothetical protein
MTKKTKEQLRKEFVSESNLALILSSSVELAKKEIDSQSEYTYEFCKNEFEKELYRFGKKLIKKHVAILTEHIDEHKDSESQLCDLKWRITMLEEKLKGCENRVEIVIDPKDFEKYAREHGRKSKTTVKA